MEYSITINYVNMKITETGKIKLKGIILLITASLVTYAIAAASVEEINILKWESHHILLWISLQVLAIVTWVVFVYNVDD